MKRLSNMLVCSSNPVRISTVDFVGEANDLELLITDVVFCRVLLEAVVFAVVGLEVKCDELCHRFPFLFMAALAEL